MKLSFSEKLVLLGVAIVVLAAVAYTTTVVLKKPVVETDASRMLSDGGDNQAQFTDLDGNPLSLSEYEGRVRVVNSWASWSPFSAQELKGLAQLSREYNPEEVVFIAINRKEQNEFAKAYLGTIGDTTGVIFVQDPTDSFYRSVGGFSMPETVLFDAEGTIASHTRGSMQLEEIRSLLDRVLAEGNN